MKFVKCLSLVTLPLIIHAACQEVVKSNLTLLSDQIPTDIPLVFAPGIISTQDKEFAITFNPEMDELFFTRRKPEGDNEIYTMKLANGVWSKPELAFFTVAKGWDFEPHISPKGDLLYFGSTRPLSDTAKATGMHQWYSKKAIEGWSEPKPLDKPFTDRFIMYITSSENSTLYFTSRDAGAKPGSGGIYYATYKGGEYGSVKRMGKEINFPLGEWIAHSYIAPDESYMIFDAQGTSGYGDCDLYLSFNNNGSWTVPHNLGPKINTELCEMCASVSPDGKYLFFQRGAKDMGDIYWVDFTLIKQKVLNTAGK